MNEATQNCHMLWFVIVHDLPWTSTLVLWFIQAKTLLRFCFVASYWWLKWLSSLPEIFDWKTEDCFVILNAYNDQVSIRVDKRFDHHVAAVFFDEVQENYFFEKLYYHADWHDHYDRVEVLRAPTPRKKYLHYDQSQIKRQVEQLHLIFLLTLFLGLFDGLPQLDHSLNVAAQQHNLQD